MTVRSDAHAWFDPLRAPDGADAGGAGAGTGGAAPVPDGGGSSGDNGGAANAGASASPIEGAVLGTEQSAAVAGEDGGAKEGEGGEKPKEEAKPDDPADKVPEGNYELKAEDLPEGFVPDQALLEEFTPALKEAGVKQKDLPKLAGVMAKIEQKRVENFVSTVKSWESQGRQDAEVGGAKYDESVTNARAAISEYGTPELRQYLFASGMGNHPELLRFCARIGAALKQGQGVRGRPSTEALPLEKKMYGDAMRNGA